MRCAGTAAFSRSGFTSEPARPVATFAEPCPSSYRYSCLWPWDWRCEVIPDSCGRIHAAARGWVALLPAGRRAAINISLHCYYGNETAYTLAHRRARGYKRYIDRLSATHYWKQSLTLKRNATRASPHTSPTTSQRLQSWPQPHYSEVADTEAIPHHRSHHHVHRCTHDEARLTVLRRLLQVDENEALGEARQRARGLDAQRRAQCEHQV